MTVEMAPLTSTQSNNREEEDTSSDDQCQKVEVQEIDQSSIWVDTWLFEILTLAFSVACFIAICVCLWVYDKKVRPQMGYRLNLNTIVSTLATGCKSSLALVVGEAICQLKWLWFQDSRQRQLFGIQAFDAASRGPLGSLKIIFYHKGRSLASLGAVVMVLLLAFDPFIQLLLSYPVIAVPHPNIGSAKQTREYPLDASAQDTLTDTIWSNKEFTIPTSCPTGNCSWDEFVSLAVCSRCWDITSLANLSCELPGTRESFNKTCVLNVPPGPPNVWEEVKFSARYQAGFNDTIHNRTQNGELKLPTEIIWNNYPSLPNYAIELSRDLYGLNHSVAMYAHASIGLREGQTAQSAPVSDSIVIKNVTMCSLSPCVRDYRLSVANGHTSAHIIKSSLGSFWPEYKDPEQRKRDEVVTIVGPYIDKVCWRPDSHTVAASGSLETNFSSCEGWMGNLGEKFDSLIPGEASTSWEWDDMLGRSQSSGWESSAALILGRILMLGFENTITRLAAALTSQSMEDSQYAVNGTSYVSDVYVSVQWPWLILPALLVLAGAVFLATTITLSRKSKLPLWKSSALASLYHGLDHTEKDEYRTASIMEKTAKMEDVQLQFSEQNGRLMLQQPKTAEAP